MENIINVFFETFIAFILAIWFVKSLVDLHCYKKEEKLRKRFRTFAGQTFY